MPSCQIHSLQAQIAFLIEMTFERVSNQTEGHSYPIAASVYTSYQAWACSWKSLVRPQASTAHGETHGVVGASIMATDLAYAHPSAHTAGVIGLSAVLTCGESGAGITAIAAETYVASSNLIGEGGRERGRRGGWGRGRGRGGRGGRGRTGMEASGYVKPAPYTYIILLPAIHTLAPKTYYNTVDG